MKVQRVCKRLQDHRSEIKPSFANLPARRDHAADPGELDTPSDLTPQATKDISAALTALLADVGALCEDQEFSLAHVRSEFSRLSPSARRTRRSTLCDD